MNGPFAVAPEHAERQLDDAAQARATSALALGTLLFLYFICLVDLAGADGKGRDLAVFAFGCGMLAPLCALSLARIGHRHRPLIPDDLAAGKVWLASAALVALSALSLLNPLTPFATNARFTTLIVALLDLLLHLRPRLRLPAGLESILSRLTSPSWHAGFRVAFFVAVFPVAILLLCYVPGDRSPWYPFLSYIRGPSFDPAGGTGFVGGILLALAGLAGAALLGLFEARVEQHHPARLRLLRRAGLAGAIALLVLFFDFSLPAQALHQLTNAAPALQLRHGGVLMVDTFSQYGPGPIVATYLWLAVLPDTLVAVDVGVQVFNLAFYAVFLVCLYRIAPLRLPALLLGLFSIIVLLASWGVGNNNINFAPSILGMRYLPTLLMVLAISGLRPSQRASIWTGAVTLVAVLWSLEAAIGTTGLHLTFIVMTGLQRRDWRGIWSGLLLCLAPAILAILLFATYTLVAAGQFPNFRIYLDFLSTYNFMSADWAVAANPDFFGWAAVMTAVFLVLADAGRRVLDGQHILPASNSVLSHRLLPMALLCLLMSTYYMGRSVDYTIVLALLPFAALVIPASLQWAIAGCAPFAKVRLVLLGVPALTFVLALGFAIAALSRDSSPYSFSALACLRALNCSVSELVGVLDTKMRQRPVLDKVGNNISDAFFDSSGTVRDAVRLLFRLQPEKEFATVLLGPVLNIRVIRDVKDQIASDAALMYAGKWHRWPRSYTFADEIVPARVAQILNAPVQLADGEVVLVRRDESLLGRIESGILRKIRGEATLCELVDSTAQVVAYRISRGATCPR